MVRRKRNSVDKGTEKEIRFCMGKANSTSCCWTKSCKWPVEAGWNGDQEVAGSGVSPSEQSVDCHICMQERPVRRSRFIGPADKKDSRAGQWASRGGDGFEKQFSRQTQDSGSEG